MAENVLHTYSKYANVGGFVAHFEEVAIETKLVDASMRFLEGQEQKLYAIVGASDYESFINTLRDIFRKYENDIAIYQSMKKAQLDKFIGAGSLLGSMQKGTTIHIKAKVDSSVTLTAKDFNFSQDGVEFIGTKGEIDVTLKYNISDMKKIINRITRNDLNETHKLNEKADKSDSYLRKVLTELVTDKRIITFTTSKDKHQVDIIEKNKNLNDPTVNQRRRDFGHTKQELTDAMWGDPQKQKEIQNAINNVHSHLAGLCASGSQLLKDSFEEAWNNKIGSNWHSADFFTMSNFSFFSKGGADTSVSGAIQEMLTGITFIYMTKALGVYNPQIAQIVGDINVNKEQPKSDVDILKSIGIQVKAYKQPDFENKAGWTELDNKAFSIAKKNHEIAVIEANLHPANLDANLSGHGFGTNNLGDALVQCCFNSSNGSIEDIAETIDKVARAQAMNMTTNVQETQQLSYLHNTVCFYFLDAQYLVPGSVILGHLTPVGATVSNHRIDITGSGTQISKSDEDYLAETLSSEHEKDGKKPLFTSYWNGNGSGGWEETEQNTNEYNRLSTHDITIRISFEFNFMFDPKYSIY